MLPMKQVLSRVAKGPAPGTLIAMQLLTLAPKPVPASSPTATLLLPSTLASLKDKTDKKPKAELYRPVVRLPRAPCPSAVLLVGTEPGSGVSVALCTCWQSPKHTSADRTVPNIIFRIFII